MPEPKTEKDRNELPDGCFLLLHGCSGGCAVCAFVMAVGTWAVITSVAAILH